MDPLEPELWAYNVLNNTVSIAQAEFNRALEAREAFIKMLEEKYKMSFNPITMKLEPMTTIPPCIERAMEGNKTTDPFLR